MLVIPSYTLLVKTAISVPDELFEQVTRWTSVLGVGRSAFFAQAARRYVQELEANSLTEQINAALDVVGDDDSWRDVTEHSRRLLARDAEDW